MPVGPNTLWPENDIPIAIELLHVDAHVRDRLRAVDQGFGAVALGQLDDRLDRRDGSERIGDLRDRDDLGPRGQQFAIFVEQDLAAVVDRNDAQRCAFFAPRVAAMARCWRGVPAWLTMISSPAPMFCRPQLCATRLIASVAPRTNTISLADRAFRKPRTFSRAAFVGVGRARGQFMRAAMHVGILVLVEILQPRR